MRSCEISSRDLGSYCTPQYVHFWLGFVFWGRGIAAAGYKRRVADLFDGFGGDVRCVLEFVIDMVWNSWDGGGGEGQEL